MNLFQKSTAGKFTSWWGEQPKVNRVRVSIRGGYWAGSFNFDSLRAAVAQTNLFNAIQKNIIS